MQMWSDWFKRLLPKWNARGEDHSPIPRRHMYILLLVALGVLLLLLNRTTTDETPSLYVEQNNEAKAIRTSGNTYEEQMAKRLQLWLEAMDGVGKVEVIITIERDEQREYAQERTMERSTSENSGSASDGERRTEEHINERPILVRKDQGRSEEPLIVTTYQPTVRGVAILAEGAGNAEVRYAIMQAVEAALGIPAHRIQVFTRRSDL